MTLFCAKYSSQVEPKLEPLQKRRQSAVVTVPLLTTCIFAQVSKLRFASVRFPRRQTLEQRKGRACFHHAARRTHWEAQCLRSNSKKPDPCYCRVHILRSKHQVILQQLEDRSHMGQGCPPPSQGNLLWSVAKPSTKLVKLQLCGSWHPQSLPKAMALVSPTQHAQMAPWFHGHSLTVTPAILVNLLNPIGRQDAAHLKDFYR